MGFKDTVKLYQPDGHHHQISHHIIVADGIMQSADQLAHLERPFGYNLLVGVLCRLRPVPGIGKGFIWASDSTPPFSLNRML